MLLLFVIVGLFSFGLPAHIPYKASDANPKYDLLPRSPKDDPRPPRERPSDEFLNKNCFANPALPAYRPFVPPGSLTGKLVVPQSDTTPYLVARWVSEFKEWFPLLEIDTPIEGSGIAGPCLTDNTCDFSIIAREMLLAELALFTNRYHYDPFEMAVAGGSYNALAFTDGMTFFVHPGNPLTSISYSELDAIWSQDRKRGYPQAITKWGQLQELKDNAEWKDRDIELVGVAIPNGFEYFLNRTILLGGKWVPNILTFSTVFLIATTVAEKPYSMGYSGLAYLNASIHEIRLREDIGWPYLRAENRGLTSSKEHVCTRAYPLSRLIYIYANKVPCQPLRPEVAEFLNYVLSYEGQKQVELDQIFYPLGVEAVQELRRDRKSVV